MTTVPSTVFPVTPDALVLAALASGALPGVRPVSAQALRRRDGERFQVGLIEDVEHRRWIVRLSTDLVAAAQLDASASLLALLSRRLPFAVPTPKGFAALDDGRRAMVYPYISGQPLTLRSLPPGRGLAAELGRAIAALHNVDRHLFEEAALPSYDAQECRRRHLADVDRGAETGQVPTRLLSRWEEQLDDIGMWRFAPTPVHGRLDGPHILATFSSPADAASGRIRAVIGWEDAHISDPAQDFAALVATAPREAVETVFEAYAMSRLAHPDPYLEHRAQLIAELRTLQVLLIASRTRDQRAISDAARQLKQLDDELADSPAPRPIGFAHSTPGQAVPLFPPIAEEPESVPLPHPADTPGQVSLPSHPRAIAAGPAAPSAAVTDPSGLVTAPSAPVSDLSAPADPQRTSPENDTAQSLYRSGTPTPEHDPSLWVDTSQDDGAETVYTATTTTPGGSARRWGRTRRHR